MGTCQQRQRCPSPSSVNRCSLLASPLPHPLSAPGQVCWSPFSPTHFLTASADWSVRLWADGQPHSLRTFQLPGAKAEVADAAFCPAAATLFAAVAGNTLQVNGGGEAPWTLGNL